MTRRVLQAIPSVALAALCAACSSMYGTRYQNNNALDFVYPEGVAEARPPRDVRLEVPVRVGIAFAPSSAAWKDPLTEVQRHRLMQRAADAFQSERFVDSIEVIPSHYLAPQGGFDVLDRLRTAFGIDLIALVSYDQRQFTETTTRSWTYVTLVGALVVHGEKNETRTLMDTVVFDISSQALLFRAAGESTIKGRATPVMVDRERRLDGEEGFEEAADIMIANLESALRDFKEQVKKGTVRGRGTPAIQVVSTPEMEARGGIGAGSLGLAEALAVAALLCGAAVWDRRRGRP